eukprot:SAG11_NODE_5973_length_1422_cov_1.252457_2_plen_282_part_00
MQGGTGPERWGPGEGPNKYFTHVPSVGAQPSFGRHTLVEIRSVCTARRTGSLLSDRTALPTPADDQFARARADAAAEVRAAAYSAGATAAARVKEAWASASAAGGRATVRLSPGRHVSSTAPSTPRGRWLGPGLRADMTGSAASAGLDPRPPPTAPHGSADRAGGCAGLVGGVESSAQRSSPTCEAEDVAAQQTIALAVSEALSALVADTSPDGGGSSAAVLAVAGHEGKGCGRQWVGGRAAQLAADEVEKDIDGVEMAAERVWAARPAAAGGWRICGAAA